MLAMPPFPPFPFDPNRLHEANGPSKHDVTEWADMAASKTGLYLS